MEAPLPVIANDIIDVPLARADYLRAAKLEQLCAISLRGMARGADPYEGRPLHVLARDAEHRAAAFLRLAELQP